jgi:DnaJ-like protein
VSYFSFELDPYVVLGVSAQATLEEIRAAYRLKSKRYHPDAGGEDWSFRILAQAYEMLSSARVARASHAEPRAGAGAGAAAAGRPRPERKSESVHPGIFDHEAPRLRIVTAELLCVRYLWDDADYLWLTQRGPDEDRFLSCNLNINWPDTDEAPRFRSPEEPAPILAALQEIFDQMIITTRVVTSLSRVQDDRFGGWLSYSNFDRAFKAVNTLHEALKSHELGLRQWSRDLFISRSRR